MDELIVPKLGRQTPTKWVYDDALQSYFDQPFVRKCLSEWWGFTPLPWQELVLRNALAINNGRFAYNNVGLSVPRQNGKTLSIEERLALSLQFLKEGAVYTSWRDDSSTAIFHRFLDRIEESKDTRPELRGFFPKLPSRKVKNQIIESIDPRTGKTLGRVRFATRKGGTGRGKSESLIIIDEAQDLTRGEHDALVAGAATFHNGQIWYVGTPEPAESSSTLGTSSAASQGLSSVFGGIRREALKGAPKTAWFEWGIDAMVPKTDRDAWYTANPSLGYDMGPGRGLTEDNLASVLGSDESFAVERLGFWSEQEKNSAIEITRWHNLAISLADAKKFRSGTIALAIKSDIGDERCDVAIAVRKPNGNLFVELIKSLNMSMAWHNAAWDILEPYIANAKCKSIIIDGATAKSQLKALLEAKGKWRSAGNKFKQGKITMASPSDLSASAALLVGCINEGSVSHSAQVNLDAAIADAGKRLFRSGSGFGFYSISGKTSSNLVEVVAMAINEASKSRVIAGDEDDSAFGVVTSFGDATNF